MSEPGLAARVVLLRDQGHADEAFALALQGFGDEVGGFLAARLLDADQSAEAFALFAEDLWRGLPGFRGEASLRTWLYVLARRAALRVIRERARAGREVPLSQAGVVDRMAAELRSATTRWRRTEAQDRLRAMRAALSEEDRELLVLRVDRGLSWEEIAAALEQDGGDPAARKRNLASLRKRFERLKERIRALALKEGLLPP
ncbi:MAG: sigma-70 family RNA polymerase sigma factor [Deltaproteobacteria bacterium]|nr:sigma-70 family RNA polymerase sigma factor [Deltaproteobacteria bacterium]